MKRRLALPLAALALALPAAACGTSTNNTQHQAAINLCTYGNASGGGNGDRPSCECAVNNAEAQGYSDSKLIAEMKGDTTKLLADTKLVRISLLCAGR